MRLAIALLLSFLQWDLEGTILSLTNNHSENRLWLLIEKYEVLQIWDKKNPLEEVYSFMEQYMGELQEKEKKELGNSYLASDSCFYPHFEVNDRIFFFQETSYLSSKGTQILESLVSLALMAVIVFIAYGLFQL